MNISKFFISSLIILVTVSGINAQDAGNLIPKNAHHIGAIDLNKIKSKQGFTELAKLPMLEFLSLNIGKELFKDTTKEKSTKYIDLGYYGINTSGKAYIYANSDSVVFYGAMVVAINNNEAFFKFVRSFVGDTTENPIVKLNNGMLARKQNFRILWNNQYAAFWTASVLPAVSDSIRRSLDEKYGLNETEAFPAFPPSNSEETAVAEAGNEEEVLEESAEEVSEAENTEEETVAEEDSAEEVWEEEVPAEEVTEEGLSEEEEEEEEEEEDYIDTYFMASQICDSILNVWIAENQMSFLSDKGLNSVKNNIEFKALVKNNPDAAFIIDYGQFVSMYMNPFKMAGLITGYESMVAQFMNIYSGVKAYITLDFNKDDVSAKWDFKYSESLNEIYKEIKKKKISPRFLPYLNKDMMGYLALGIDIGGISKGVGNYIRKSLPSIPQYGDMAVSVMDLIDIVIDEERLYNIFSGDIVIAVNDVKPIQIIHKGYDFDDEYNKIETVDTTVQERPEALIMIGVGNNDDVNKIFQILIRSKLIKSMGNYYGLEKESASFPVYFRVMNNIIFISNNQEYIENPTVYASKARLNKKHTAMFKKNTAVLYTNLDKISTYFVSKDLASFNNSIVEASKTFSELTYYGSIKKKGRISSNYVLKLKETNDNSLTDLFKFFNFIYIEKGKQKEAVIYE